MDTRKVNIDDLAIPLLSEETKQQAIKAQYFAYCVTCHRLYQDDLPGGQTIFCPYDSKTALFRGLTKEAIQQKKLKIRSSGEDSN